MHLMASRRAVQRSPWRAVLAGVLALTALLTLHREARGGESAADGALGSLPNFSFTVTTWKYAIPQPPAEPGGEPTYSFASESLEAEAALGWELAARDGRPALMLRTEVVILREEDGSVSYREYLPPASPGEERSTLRSLNLPLGSDPRRAAHPFVALHPLAPVMAELEEAFIEGQEITSIEQRDDGGLTMESDAWRWELQTRGEFGDAGELRQYSQKSGALLRETLFEDWHWTDGRRIPRRVLTRTRLPDGRLVVEKVYEEIRTEPALVDEEQRATEPVEQSTP